MGIVKKTRLIAMPSVQTFVYNFPSIEKPDKLNYERWYWHQKL